MASLVPNQPIFNTPAPMVYPGAMWSGVPALAPSYPGIVNPYQSYVMPVFTPGSMAEKILSPLLTTGQMLVNSPKYHTYLLALTDGSALHLTDQEPRLLALLQVYKDHEGQAIQKELFQYIYNEIQVDPNHLPTQTSLLFLLNELYAHTRAPEHRTLIEKWLSENLIPLKDQKGQEMAYHVFSPFDPLLLFKLPEQVVGSIESFCETAALMNTDVTFSELAFMDNPANVFKNLMDEYAHMYQLNGASEAFTDQRQAYLQKLIDRGMQLLLYYPDKIGRLLLNQAYFQVPERKRYYQQFLQTMIQNIPYANEIFQQQDTMPIDNPNTFQDIHLNQLTLLWQSLADTKYLPLFSVSPSVSVTGNGANQLLPPPIVPFTTQKPMA